MVCLITRLLFLLHGWSGLNGVAGKGVRYGKYFEWQYDNIEKMTGKKKDYRASTYYLYRPPKTAAKSPVIFQIYGSGWIDGDWVLNPINDIIKAYNRQGFAFVSADFRSLAIKYWYEEGEDDKE